MSTLLSLSYATHHIAWCAVVWRGMVWCGVPKALLRLSKSRDVLHMEKAKQVGLEP